MPEKKIKVKERPGCRLFITWSKQNTDQKRSLKSSYE